MSTDSVGFSYTLERVDICSITTKHVLKTTKRIHVSSAQSLLSLIEQHYPSLSPTARNIANYVQQHPMAVVTLSVADIARATATSKATVSRFFRQLGYDSHQDAKQAMLSKRATGYPIADSANTSDYLANEIGNLETTFAHIDEAQLDTIASQLSVARRVILIGFRNSYSLALTFRQQLKQMRPHVHLYPVPGQTLSEDLIDIDDEDMVIVFGLRRRPQFFSELITQLQSRNTLLITDPSGQVYNQKVSHLMVCQLGNQQAFDSYAAPMALIATLSNKVYAVLDETGQLRTAAISDMYEQLGELDIQ